jgi:isoamylase
VFRRSRFLAGAEAAELRWFTPEGTEMNGGDWSDPSALAIALYLDGADDPGRAANGTWLVEDGFLVLVNAWWDPVAPASAADEREAGDSVTVGPRAVVVVLNPLTAAG